jgi:hypothetical protein
MGRGFLLLPNPGLKETVMNNANSPLNDLQTIFGAMLDQAGSDPEARLAVLEAFVCAVDNKLQSNASYMRYQALCRRLKQMQETLDDVERLASATGDQAVADLASHAKNLLK